jgi:branched-subunit amino acid ABC-type transport system permease component
MDAYPELNGNTNVVFTVHWTLTGGEAGFVSSVYGAAGVTLDPDAAFTPYANLTQVQVVGWVKSALGAEQVASYEANVATQINNQIVPPVVTPPLPWE